MRWVTFTIRVSSFGGTASIASETFNPAIPNRVIFVSNGSSNPDLVTGSALTLFCSAIISSIH